VLFEIGDLIDQVYFPTGAVFSIILGLSTGEMVETAMVGKDGVVGASSAVDSQISTITAIVQLAGSAAVCNASALKAAAMQSTTLLSALIRHEQALLSQVQQSAACLAAHNTEESRWLLRARDLSGGDTLNFTQEFLAEMLGIQGQRLGGCAHAATSRNDLVRVRQNTNPQCRGDA
jgi:CRP-like cAMP-binding protein